MKIEKDKILLEISESEKTTILFESPHRLEKTLQELKKYCGGEREIQVSRELTKKFEENICTSIDNLIDFFTHKEIRGEITIVLKGIKKGDIGILSKAITLVESTISSDRIKANKFTIRRKRR